MKHQSLQDELLKLAESQAKSFLPKDAKDDVYFLPHKPWEFGQAKGIKEHHEPHGPMERAAFQTAQFLRGLLDNIAGYEPVPVHAGKKIQKDVAQAVSCVTTAQAARAQHVRSMWKGEPDNGWCRALLLESDNERVHLLTALKITHANRLVRMGIITLQSVVSPFSFIAYVMCPKYCHRLYEYLQEESIKIYTQCIEDIEEGSMDLWKNQVAPTIAKKYWHLKDDATVEDVLKAIRADEDKHRCTHHMLANAKYVVNLDPTKLPQ
ncbi:hypothetical protein BaRGS_00011235 [Batillaria attramentaria]|uniref:Alternative oxidase n=1 Tax=Batillaria attramentaria TaxID=370345 RepID=A0ABD0LDY3_9CAEN